MKIRKLFLKAFGPFTGTTLDFSGAANLHVIYGPNEAGKSSALRAMADLRYGIHARSKDDFVHDFKSMLLAGCFEDASGRAVGLARRKGNKDTLLMADPETGDPVAGGPITPDVLLALTGGVAREQFQTMYGLDSDHLRKGGQLLVQGEGELGAALFEASTGSAGIKAMLATLQADAKKFFAPRSQSAVLNESARQLDEARQRYRQAVTKPDQWKALNRAHEEAARRLVDIRSQLSAQRRRFAELAELRAVEPLLRQLDLAANEWTEVQGHVALAADARDLRIRASHEQAQAETAVADADEALAQCQQEAQVLQIEPALLAHATAIDRLDSDLVAVRRDRDMRAKLEASAGAEAQLLMMQAARMTEAVGATGTLEEMFRRAPSAADHAELEAALDQLKSLTHDLQHVQGQIRDSRARLDQLEREKLAEPPQQSKQALSLALAQAQPLGDAERRLTDMEGAAASERRKLDGALADLGLASVEQLTASRWLAFSEIDAYEKQRADVLNRLAILESDATKVKSDLAGQQRRRAGLAATGEVVTADTLLEARTQRDLGWQTIRGVFIDQNLPPPGDAAKAELPEAFERTQTAADRQADLLREGAQRAAEIAECEQRILEMSQALAELELARAEQERLLATLDGTWAKTLAGRGLAEGSAAAVREWLGSRQVTLDLNERLTKADRDCLILEQQVADAMGMLAEALVATGSVALGGIHSLAGLVTLGTAADRDMVAAQTAIKRRTEDIAGVEHDIQQHGALEAGLDEELDLCRAGLDGKCHRLYLAAGATPEAIKARLGELRDWASGYLTHLEYLGQLQRIEASERLVESAAQALGSLLHQPTGEHLDAWVDGLTERLALSQEAARTKAELDRREGEEAHRRKRGLAQMEDASKVLDSLVRAAGVQHADELPDAEGRSARRLEVSTRLESLTSQLVQTSEKDAAALRTELANQDSVAIDLEKQTCAAEIERLEAGEKVAIGMEQATQTALAAVDTSDEAAHAREEMEEAIARYRAGVRPWAQLKLAEVLLAEALRRHREKAQGPVVELAGEYLKLMTAGRFVRLLVDADGDEPQLLAQPAIGKPLAIGELSEGTADQLHLALRLAALQVQRQVDRVMPLVLDDVFITSDDERAASIFLALEKFAEHGQVLVFTHHHHLTEIASRTVAPAHLRVHQLAPSFANR